MDKRHVIAVAFLDLKKAFDSVAHHILLQRLVEVGITGTAVQWFSSYFVNRFQRVATPMGVSELAKIITGVPQGSVLCPMMFNVFINPLLRMNELWKDFNAISLLMTVWCPRLGPHDLPL